MRSLVALLLLAGAPPDPPLFEDIAATAGLTIKVVSGDPAEKKYLIESIGGIETELGIIRIFDRSRPPLRVVLLRMRLPTHLFRYVATMTSTRPL